MPKRPLRVVNEMPDQNQQVAGVSLRTVLIAAAVTTIASQLVIDGYRLLKLKIKERRAAANPPGFQPRQLPTHPGTMPLLAPHTPSPVSPGWQPPWDQPAEPEPNPDEDEPQRPLSAAELQEWEGALERKEQRLDQGWDDLQAQQRHLRLLGGG